MLRPLTSEEVAPYLENRLRVAGAARALLAPATGAEVHRQTGGIPRLINMLADRMLLLGYVDGAEKLDPARVREAWADLGRTLISEEAAAS